MDRKSARTGFTLIEMMIVLVVLAITVALGAPMMQTQLHQNRLRAESSRLLGAINLARSEAVMRNMPVSLCPSTMAATGEPKCSGTYSGGWIVFANANKDRVVDPDSDHVLQVFEALPPGYRLTNRAGKREAFELINYLADGSSHSNRTLMFCPPPGIPVQALGIIINIVGRARLAAELGVCPAV
jgi:type IV fimbrial biogenesis protein FimT